MAWNEAASGLVTSRYAVLEAAHLAPTPTLHTLLGPRAQPLLHKAATAGYATLLWRGVPNNGNNTWVYGVTLNHDGTPMRSTSGSVEFEPVPLPWLTGADDLRIGTGDQLDLATYSLTRMWPQDTLDSMVSVVSEVSAGPVAFATWNRSRLLARGQFAATNVVVGGPFTVLLFANTTNGVNITPVWRRTLQ